MLILPTDFSAQCLIVFPEMRVRFVDGFWGSQFDRLFEAAGKRGNQHCQAVIVIGINCNSARKSGLTGNRQSIVRRTVLPKLVKNPDG